MNLMIGDCKPLTPFSSSFTLIQARPLAPYMLTYLVYSSICLRDSAAPPGTLSAATRPLGSLAGPANTLNSMSCNKSATSTNSIGIRRSGLSEPKRFMASAYVICGNSPRSTFSCSSKIALIIDSAEPMMSSSFINEDSISI